VTGNLHAALMTSSVPRASSSRS